MRVFTYIAPAMRPGGSSNRITVKENQIMHTVKTIIYTYTNIHIQYTIYFTFFFKNQTDEIEKNTTLKQRLLQQQKKSRKQTSSRQYMLQIIYRYETCLRE